MLKQKNVVIIITPTDVIEKVFVIDKKLPDLFTVSQIGYSFSITVMNDKNVVTFFICLQVFDSPIHVVTRDMQKDIIKRIRSHMPSIRYVIISDLHGNIASLEICAVLTGVYNDSFRFDKPTAFLIINGDIYISRDYLDKLCSPRESEKALPTALATVSSYKNKFTERNNKIENMVYNFIKRYPSNVLLIYGNHDNEYPHPEQQLFHVIINKSIYISHSFVNENVYSVIPSVSPDRNGMIRLPYLLTEQSIESAKAFSDLVYNLQLVYRDKSDVLIFDAAIAGYLCEKIYKNVNRSSCIEILASNAFRIALANAYVCIAKDLHYDNPKSSLYKNPDLQQLLYSRNIEMKIALFPYFLFTDHVMDDIDETKKNSIKSRRSKLIKEHGDIYMNEKLYNYLSTYQSKLSDDLFAKYIECKELIDISVLASNMRDIVTHAERRAGRVPNGIRFCFPINNGDKGLEMNIDNVCGVIREKWKLVNPIFVLGHSFTFMFVDILDPFNRSNSIDYSDKSKFPLNYIDSIKDAKKRRPILATDTPGSNLYGIQGGGSGIKIITALILLTVLIVLILTLCMNHVDCNYKAKEYNTYWR